MKGFAVPHETIYRAHAMYMADPDCTLRHVADEYGSSPRSWVTRFKRLELPLKPSGRGRSSPSVRTELSEAQEADLQRLIKQGAGPRLLMRKFRIGAGRARRLIQRATADSISAPADRPAGIVG